MAERPNSTDIDALREMAAASRTLRDIGVELGVSRQTIMNWSRAYGNKNTIQERGCRAEQKEALGGGLREGSCSERRKICIPNRP